MKNLVIIEAALEAAISPDGDLVIMQDWVNDGRQTIRLNLAELESLEKYIGHFRHAITPPEQEKQT